MILQPTSPLRTLVQINKALKIFNEKIKALMSVSKNKSTPFKDMIIKNSKLHPIFDQNNLSRNDNLFHKHTNWRYIYI